MQIVKVKPLAEINAIFCERAARYNIDGFDTWDGRERQEGGKDIRLGREGKREGALATPHYLLKYRREIVNRYRSSRSYNSRHRSEFAFLRIERIMRRNCGGASLSLPFYRRIASQNSGRFQFPINARAI